MKYKYTVNNKIIIILKVLLIINCFSKSLSAKEKSLEMILKGSSDKNGGFANPAGIVVGKDGKIFIVDSLNTRVQVFNEKGEFLYFIGKSGMGGGEFMLPSGIAMDNKGYLFVTDIGQHRIHVFEQDGNFLTQFGGEGKGEGKFSMPFDLAISQDGFIYIVDTGNNIVQVIKGKFLFQFGESGVKDGQLNSPMGIELGQDGNIYIADTKNSRIQVFSNKGKYIRKFGRAGSGDGDMNSPEGITLDKKGNIYVPDRGNNRIQVFSNDGRFMFKFGDIGKNPEQFNSPGKIKFYENKILVADSENNRVQIFCNLIQNHASCLFCHVDKEKLLKTAKVIHSPFEENCEDCHKRHSMDEKVLSKEEIFEAKGNEICYKCHDTADKDFMKKHQDFPVTNIECIGCHSPHAADKDKLLLMQHGEILKCNSCHVKEGNGVKYIAEKDHICNNCHKLNLDIPHNMNLVSVEIKEKLANVINGKKNECLICHVPHGSINEFNLIKSGQRLCYLCHDFSKINHQHKVDVTPSRKIKISADFLLLSREGKIVCYTCHNVHSNQNKPCLSFPKGELCSKCHTGGNN
ncbi:6-bladed beta-propeller [Candidatus Desantisbacteria bacterium]|nr:6-bladed beta-propeller [Candidatus Desantisbacteria bacterium]